MNNYIAEVIVNNIVQIIKTFDNKKSARQFLDKIYKLNHKADKKAKLINCKLTKDVYRQVGQWPLSIQSSKVKNEILSQKLKDMKVYDYENKEPSGNFETVYQIIELK